MVPENLICPDCKGTGRALSVSKKKSVCKCCGGSGRVNYFLASAEMQEKLANQYAS